MIKHPKWANHWNVQVFLGVDVAGRRKLRKVMVCPTGCVEPRHRNARKLDRPTKAKVERLARQIEEEERERSSGGESPTVGEVFARSMAAVDRAESTRAAYRSCWGQRISVSFASRPIAEVRVTDLAAYRDHHAKAGRVSARTVNQDMAILAGIFRWAHEQGLIEVNPAANLRRAKQEAGETRLPSDEALKGLLMHLAADDRRRSVALMVWVGMAIGARRGELAALTWGDVDPEAGSITIDKAVSSPDQGIKSTKTRGTRVVPVGPQVVELLAGACEQSQAAGGAAWRESWPVFFADDPSVRPHIDYWSKAVREVTADHEDLDGPCRLCGCDSMADVNIKALRHRVATATTQAFGAVVAAKMLGHSSPVMTANVYSHGREDEGRAAAAALDAGLPVIDARTRSTPAPEGAGVE